MLKKTNLSVLVIGSGGREHALAWKLKQSKRVQKLYVAPGNGGTDAAYENVAIPVTDIPALVAFAKEHDIDLTVVGPDDALAGGIVDTFTTNGLVAFGPTKAAAQIEASKAFAKQLMKKADVPTARFATFKNFDEASAYVKQHNGPLVVKASGLALGKGVLICQTGAEAEAALRSIMLEHVFGDAGSEVVIEELLSGKEISIHALSDGKSAALFPPSQDNKRVGEGDTGLNTGGMGAVAPVPWVTPEMMADVDHRVVCSILDQLAQEKATFIGCLYPGLMVSGSSLNVIEYNARFGDPETQVYMPLLENDFVDVIEACLSQKLDSITLKWRAGYAACVVLASGGYPGNYAKNMPIGGLEEVSALENIHIFHAGTVMRDGIHYTSGGRVLNVVATGTTLQEALDRAYEAIKKISFDKMYYRRDIGAKALV